MVKVYTGTELTVEILKGKLAEIGIVALVKNHFNSGIIAGFGGGNPSSVELYLNEIDLEKARTLIEDFTELN